MTPLRLAQDSPVRARCRRFHVGIRTCSHGRSAFSQATPKSQPENGSGACGPLSTRHHLLSRARERGRVPTHSRQSRWWGLVGFRAGRQHEGVVSCWSRSGARPAAPRCRSGGGVTARAAEQARRVGLWRPPLGFLLLLRVAPLVRETSHGGVSRGTRCGGSCSCARVSARGGVGRIEDAKAFNRYERAPRLTNRAPPTRVGIASNSGPTVDRGHSEHRAASAPAETTNNRSFRSRLSRRQSVNWAHSIESHPLPILRSRQARAKKPTPS
jgi:hypothetical protein